MCPSFKIKLTSPKFQSESRYPAVEIPISNFSIEYFTHCTASSVQRIEMNQFDSICQALGEIERTNKFILKRLHQQENYLMGDEGNGYSTDREIGNVLEKMVELEARNKMRDEQIERLMDKVARIGDKLASILSDFNENNSNLVEYQNVQTTGNEAETTEDLDTEGSTESCMKEVTDSDYSSKSRDETTEHSSSTLTSESGKIGTDADGEILSSAECDMDATSATHNATSNTYQVHDGSTLTDTDLLSESKSDVEKHDNDDKLKVKLTSQGCKLRRKRTDVNDDNRLAPDLDKTVVTDTQRKSRNIEKVVNKSPVELSPPLHVQYPVDPEEKWKRDRELLAKATPVDAAEVFRLKASLASMKGRSLSHLRGKGIDTIFVIDTSESMVGEGFRQIQSAFKGIMEEIQETSQPGHEENVAVITFGTETEVLEHLSCNYSKIKNCLDNVECRGPSPLLTGLWLVLGPLHGGAGGNVFAGWHIEPRVILMTDGRATPPTYPDGPENPDMYDKAEVNMNIIQYVQNMKASLYCVPVGDPDMDILETMSAICNGQIVHLHEVRTKLGRFQINASRASRLNAFENKGWETVSDEMIIQQLLTHPAVDSREKFLIKDGDGSEMREMLCNQQRFKPTDDDDDDDNYTKFEDPSMPSFGSRVRRGPDWKWKNQDSRGPGTVVGHGQPGSGQEKWIRIQWDSGESNRYRFGAEGSIDVMVVDEPKVLINQLIDIGCLVTRGPDWMWENQDGGAGNIGSVFKLTNDGKVYVRWPTGIKNSYRFGMDGKFDLTVCDPFDPSVKRKIAQQNLSHGATASVSPKTTTKPNMSAKESVTQPAKESTAEIKELTTKPKEFYSSSELKGSESVSIYDLAPPATQVSTHEEEVINHSKKHLKRKVKSEERHDKHVNGSNDKSKTSENIKDFDHVRNNESSETSKKNINKVDSENKVSESVEDNSVKTDKEKDSTLSKTSMNISDFLQRQDIRSGKDDDASDSVSVISEVSSSLSPSEPTLAQWQWRDSEGLWVSYPETTNQKIEKVFQKHPKATAFVSVDEKYYRIIFSKGIQISMATHEETEVRRLEPMNDVANLKDVDSTTDQ